MADILNRSNFYFTFSPQSGITVRKCVLSYIKSKGRKFLTNHLWVIYISWGKFFLPYFSWPNCFRQQPILFYRLISGNYYYIFTETVEPIYLLSGYLDCFVKCFYFVWLEVVCSCHECLGESAAVAVSSRWAVSIAKVAVRIGIGWGVVGQANVISSSECRAI